MWFELVFFPKSSMDCQKILALDRRGGGWDAKTELNTREGLAELLSQGRFTEAEILFRLRDVPEKYINFFELLGVREISLYVRIEKEEHLKELIDFLKEINFPYEVRGA